MPKIKLLFDVEQLCVCGMQGTGVVRVCDVLLRELLKCSDIDLYLIVTSKRGNIATYLEAKGLMSSFGNKIVYMPKLKATTKNQGLYQKLRTRILTKFYSYKYMNKLKEFDAYLSLFSPISPVIYASGLKTFMVVHDLIPIYHPDGCEPKFVRKFYDWIKRSHPSAYLCDSNHTISDLRRFKPETADIPCYTMHLGADDKFKPENNATIRAMVKERYAIKTDKYFLAVSEITTRKNLPHLLQAFVCFLQDSGAEDVSLVLVGPTRDGYSALASAVKGLDKYQDKIVMTGYVDDNDLAPLYSGALAFIYPSLYEGFGLPVLEAMQCGTPVICANNTSLPEVGGDAVLYVSGKDKVETAQMLYKVYSDPQLTEVMKNKGLAKAKEFNWQKTAEVVIKAVKHTIEGDKND